MTELISLFSHPVIQKHTQIVATLVPVWRMPPATKLSYPSTIIPVPNALVRVAKGGARVRVHTIFTPSGISGSGAFSFGPSPAYLIGSGFGYSALCNSRGELYAPRLVNPVHLIRVQTTLRPPDYTGQVGARSLELT